MIANGTVFAPINEGLPISVVSRLLATCAASNRAVLIEVPSGPRIKEGRKHANYYARGFFTVPLSKLVEWIDTKQLVETHITLPGWRYASDEISEKPSRRVAKRKNPLRWQRETENGA